MAEDAPHILMGVPGIAEAPGPATVWATDRRTSVLDATLVNGTASHALDYDDVSGVMGGHPSAMLVPSMIALGESVGRRGRDLALAYVVGYETECRIARGVHFHHYDKGWHPTATIGIFGTVAARVAPARADGRADRGRTWPRRIAGIGAEGEFRHDDETTARRSRIAQRFVRDITWRATASPPTRAASNTSKASWMCSTAPEPMTPAKMLANWYAPPECEGPGEPGLKPYPCCGSTHASVNRMLHLANTHDLQASDVDAIEVMPHLRRLPHTNNPDPRTPLEAKFSIQYCVARALTDRAVQARAFREWRGERSGRSRIAAADPGASASRHARRWRLSVGRRGRCAHQGRTPPRVARR